MLGSDRERRAGRWRARPRPARASRRRSPDVGPGRARVDDDPGELGTAAVRQQDSVLALPVVVGASLASTIGLRSSTGRSPWGALEPRLRLSAQLIAGNAKATASASVRALFSLQNRPTAAVGGMIARVPDRVFHVRDRSRTVRRGLPIRRGTGGAAGAGGGRCGGTSGEARAVRPARPAVRALPVPRARAAARARRAWPEPAAARGRLAEAGASARRARAVRPGAGGRARETAAGAAAPRRDRRRRGPRPADGAGAAAAPAVRRAGGAGGLACTTPPPDRGVLHRRRDRRHLHA